MFETPGARVLDGRYEVLRVLGAGSFGEVYEVFDHNLRVHAALKLLGQAPSSGHPWAEAHVLQALDGPFVLKVLNADVHLGQQYIVTELAVNGTIADHIVSDVGVPVEQARRWTRDLCHGVARMHRDRLVHRDIKPENVFLSAKGAAMVGDVGLAQLVDDDGSAAAAGTLLTMAPEVAGAACGGPVNSYTVRSDVYSIGASLYWMLAGHRVLPAATTYADVVAGQPDDLAEAAPHVPLPLRKAVMKALSADPAARFASVVELDAAIGGVGSPRRRWDRRSPHSGHEQCFRGVGSSAAIELCVVAQERPGTVALRHQYASGRSLAKHDRVVTRARLAAAIRSTIRAIG